MDLARALRHGCLSVHVRWLFKGRGSSFAVLGSVLETDWRVVSALELDMLSDLGRVWRETSIEAKDVLVGSIWPEGFWLDGEKCRTPEPSPLIGLFGGESQKMKDAEAHLYPGVSSSGDGGS